MRIINGNFNMGGGLQGSILPDVPEPGAWVTREQLTDSAGRAASMPSWATECFGNNGAAVKACAARMDSMYQVVVSYQPAGRFWTLQFWELGIYLALAVALAAFCVYWLRERVS
jgi:hypothetical protein